MSRLLWVIPSIFLMLTIGLFVLFVAYNPFFRTWHETGFVPATVVPISESFSGELYFNTKPHDETEFSDLIISAINHASSTIEMAVYSFNHPGIRDALYAAAARGVEVRMILSENRARVHDAVFSDLPHSIHRIDVGNDPGYMHHKFLLIDRGLVNAELFFGSYNFTVLQEKYDSSFMLITTRSEIISIFGQEFDHIFNKETRYSSRNPFAALLIYPEGSLEIWFSPPRKNKDEVRHRLRALIQDAQVSIDSLIWNITDEDISRALFDRARAGIHVRILTDDFTATHKDSTIPSLLADQKKYNLSTLEILTDEGRGSAVEGSQEGRINPFLHQHVLISDHRIVWFGTNNWSRNGFTNSHESIMVSDIPYIVSSFSNAFEEEYALVNE